MSILVIAEHSHGAVLAATYSAISAARKIGGDIDVLAIGSQLDEVVKTLSTIAELNTVLVADASAYRHLLAENVAEAVVGIAANYSHILTPASTTGKNFMPRVAALLDVTQISDIVAVVSEDTFVRPIYAGNALATVQSHEATKVLTIRASAFDPDRTQGEDVLIKIVDIASESTLSEFVNEQTVESTRPDLGSAEMVISGGRGMKNKENFALLESLADKLGAAVGASRAAVDAGFAANDLQVGQTGKIVAPNLYMAVGISGAIQHLAGMSNSKVIVAINSDAEAPIFQVADYGLVADLFEAIPTLNELL